MASEEADFEVENLCTSIREALTPYPNGLSRERLYTKTEASSLQMLVKAIHRLREAGDVVNITGTPTGPYMLVPDSYKEKQAAKAAEPEEIPSSGLETDDDSGDESDSPANGSEAQVEPVKAIKPPKAVPKMGTLRSNTARAHIAFAAYAVHKEHPGLYASYDVIFARVAPSHQTMKTRASVIAQLIEAGYLERSLVTGSPRVRWNASRFNYPFPDFSIIPSGTDLTTGMQRQVLTSVGDAVLMASQVTPTGIEPVTEVAKTPACVPVGIAPSSHAVPEIQPGHLLQVSHLEARVNALTDSVCQMLSEMRGLLTDIQKLRLGETITA